MGAAGGYRACMTNRPVRGSLNALVKDHRSPVRRFLAARFSAGLHGVQRRYRESVPELAVPSGGARPGTVAGAADWLLRFLVHPAPDLDLVMAGARSCRTACWPSRRSPRWTSWPSCGRYSPAACCPGSPPGPAAWPSGPNSPARS